MARETCRAPRPEDGGGKEEKELLFLYCGTLGPGYPPGHRPSSAWFFARWRHFLWQVWLETTGWHIVQATHDRHPSCGAGSMIVLEDDPYVALLQAIISARSERSSEREQALNPFIVFPIDERNGRALHIIVSGSEITWEAIERTALGLVRWNDGDPSRARCVWKDRDEEGERLYWEQEIHRKHIAWLRREPPGEAEVVSSAGIARIAKKRGETLGDVRKRLSDDGFAEDEYGNFIRKKPELDEGESETFALVLRGYAKRVNYAGPLFLSAHSWEELFFVAAEQRFVARFKGKRAWYGYLQGVKQLVCIPVANRFEVAAYAEYSIPGDPDFFEAMDEIRPASSDVVNEGLAALEEKERRVRENGG